MEELYDKFCDIFNDLENHNINQISDFYELFGYNSKNENYIVKENIEDKFNEILKKFSEEERQHLSQYPYIFEKDRIFKERQKFLDGTITEKEFIFLIYQIFRLDLINGDNYLGSPSELYQELFFFLKKKIFGNKQLTEEEEKIKQIKHYAALFDPKYSAILKHVKGYKENFDLESFKPLKVDPSFVFHVLFRHFGIVDPNKSVTLQINEGNATTFPNGFTMVSLHELIKKLVSKITPAPDNKYYIYEEESAQKLYCLIIENNKIHTLYPLIKEKELNDKKLKKVIYNLKQSEQNEKIEDRKFIANYHEIPDHLK